MIYQEQADYLLKEINKVKQDIKKVLKILRNDKDDKNGKENN